ncbi:MAG: hypothetical protein A3K77_05690 [Euryarchaeota archaeon RBG_13_31_8]|nr:MAG: hypothetical protein A3K77_05690 [Euryarchaeota archaeon RBG_13_31_8]
MPLGKKIVLTIVITLLICITISVVAIQYFIPMVFGTKFTLLESYRISDDDGFPSLSINFTCSGTVTVKIIGPDSKVIDSDFFFKGDHDVFLRIAEYRQTAAPGQYILRVSDNDDKEIFSEKITFKGSDLTILSCEQKWLNEIKINSYSLFGLKLLVQNSGDMPVYPYKFSTIIDSEIISSFALPCVIMPKENKYVECFLYKKSEPKNSSFSLDLKDIDNNILTSEPILKNVVDNVPTKLFTWNNNRNKANIPKSDFLYNYYSNLDRINNEDYSLYVFDFYDDQYLDIVANSIMAGLGSASDVEKVNYAASFVQNLEYKTDSVTNDSYEYPNYPIESLFNDNIGRDCEDKAILTASILENMGFNVALLRFPNHMAVGVNLSKNAISQYQYYVDNYFFLETTTEGKPCGFVPNEYKDLVSEVIIYPIVFRPLLIHHWENNAIMIYSNTERGDFVKVKAVIENLGSTTAEDFKVEGAFYNSLGVKANYESLEIGTLEPGMKKELTLNVSIPKNLTTWFKTRIYIDNEVVDEKESASSFP